MILNEFKKLFNQFELWDILKSLLFSLVVMTIIFAPFFLIGVNLLFLYIYKIYTILTFMDILLGIYIVLLTKLFYNTLATYNKEHTVNINLLFRVDAIFSAFIFMLVGLILILTITPKFLV